MAANVDRIRARVIWLLARLRTNGAGVDASVSIREALAACECESVDELRSVVENLPQGVVCEIGSASLRLSGADRADLEADTKAVAEYWRQATGRDRRTELTTKRLSLIRARLRAGRTVDELRRAVDACMASDWHTGANPNGQRYTDCEHIFAAERLDRWLSPASTIQASTADVALAETLQRRATGRQGR
jgi:uncharacterized phage protein (TIGR02220 family)